MSSLSGGGVGFLCGWGVCFFYFGGFVVGFVSGVSCGVRSRFAQLVVFHFNSRTPCYNNRKVVLGQLVMLSKDYANALQIFQVCICVH